MNEYQRQAYLSALGVDAYVPRWRLPVAPEPVACERPVPAPSGEEGLEPAASTPAAAVQGQAEVVRREPAPRKVAEVLKDIPGPERTPVERATADAVDRPEAREKLEPFTLSIWRSPLPLLVLDAREPRAALPTDRLLRNILQALQAHDGERVQEEVLAWPSVHNPAVHLRAEDAQAELHTWLEMELAQRPVRQLLLLGEKAARFFLPEGAGYAASLWHTIALEPFGRPALVAPSLLELLREPRRKRDLWRALQTLPPLDVSS